MQTISEPINGDWGDEDVKVVPRFCVFVRRRVKLPPRCDDKKRKFRFAKLKVPVASVMVVYTIALADRDRWYNGCRQLVGWTLSGLYNGEAPRKFWPTDVFDSMDIALAAAQRMQDTFGNVPEDNVMYPDTYPDHITPVAF